MKAAIAIGVTCEYCHAGKEHFTDKFEMAVNMFKLSEMMDVECDFCHKGKGILTSHGKTAKTAMLVENWVETGNEKCLECHIEKKQFELNSHGESVLKTLICEQESNTGISAQSDLPLARPLEREELVLVFTRLNRQGNQKVESCFSSSGRY